MKIQIADSVVQKMQKWSESPVTSHMVAKIYLLCLYSHQHIYVLMTVQTEKSLRNVINQSPHACAHINGIIKGKIFKSCFSAIKSARNMIQLAVLSYIFTALFKDTSLAYVYGTWYNGHMAIEPRATNMANWGIPEKNHKNVPQQC